EEAAGVEVDAGLLLDLAAEAVERMFALCEESADEIPPSSPRVESAPGEEHAALVVLGERTRRDGRVRVQEEPARCAIDDIGAAGKLTAAPPTPLPPVEPAQ